MGDGVRYRKRKTCWKGKGILQETQEGLRLFA